MGRQRLRAQGLRETIAVIRSEHGISIGQIYKIMRLHETEVSLPSFRNLVSGKPFSEDSTEIVIQRLWRLKHLFTPYVVSFIDKYQFMNQAPNVFDYLTEQHFIPTFNGVDPEKLVGTFLLYRSMSENGKVVRSYLNVSRTSGGRYLKFELRRLEPEFRTIAAEGRVIWQEHRTKFLFIGHTKRIAGGKERPENGLTVLSLAAMKDPNMTGINQDFIRLAVGVHFLASDFTNTQASRALIVRSNLESLSLDDMYKRYGGALSLSEAASEISSIFEIDPTWIFDHETNTGALSNHNEPNVPLRMLRDSALPHKK